MDWLVNGFINGLFGVLMDDWLMDLLVDWLIVY